MARQDEREAVLHKVEAAALCQLKSASKALRTHARRELCTRLCRYEGASITDLDVECLNNAGRLWEVVIAGRQLPQLARLRGYGFVVDVQAVREADLGGDGRRDATLGGAALRSCIQGEGDPQRELLLAAVACAASGTVRRVPVQRLREGEAIARGSLYLNHARLGPIGAALLGLMLPAATSVRSLSLWGNNIGVEGVSALAAVLKETVISYLNIASNRIGDEGAFALAAILKETKITTLGLDFNHIGPEGASALAAVLKETQITDLTLYWNNIGPEGASALAAVLKETQITNLNLAENALCGLSADEDGDIQGILHRDVGRYTDIQGIQVNLKGTYTAEGITKLCEGLKGSAVTSLDLSGNRLSDQATMQVLLCASRSGVTIFS